MCVLHCLRWMGRGLLGFCFLFFSFFHLFEREAFSQSVSQLVSRSVCLFVYLLYDCYQLYRIELD